jgi:hypothetical protein
MNRPRFKADAFMLGSHIEQREYHIAVFYPTEQPLLRSLYSKAVRQLILALEYRFYFVLLRREFLHFPNPTSKWYEGV